MLFEACKTALLHSPVLLLRWRAGPKRPIEAVAGDVQGIFGRATLTGLDYDPLIHPLDRERIALLLAQADAARATSVRLDYRLVSEDGSEHAVSEHATPVRNGNGTLTHWEGVVIVDRGVLSRLERCERELQDFAYIASHDLQEPLRKVQAFGDLLKSKFSAELGEQGLDYLARMLGASGRMQGFLEGLLEYSRVTTQGKPFSKTNLTLVCSEVVERLKAEITRLHAHVAIGDLPLVQADAEQMRQLLHHLIGNALKFHLEGVNPVIGVSATIDGNRVWISVKDNGTGFRPEDAGKLFQLFQRLHGRTEYPGAGIGLAVCRKIVERHHGEIRAASTPGSGANFLFSLPIQQPSEEEPHG